MTYCNLKQPTLSRGQGRGTGLTQVIQSALDVLASSPYDALSFQVSNWHVYIFKNIFSKHLFFFTRYLLFLLEVNYQVSLFLPATLKKLCKSKNNMNVKRGEKEKNNK